LTNSEKNDKQVKRVSFQKQPNDDEGWQTVESKKKLPFSNALPRSFLLPKPGSFSNEDAPLSIGLLITINPPVQDKEPIYIVPRIAAKLLSSLQHVCVNTALCPLEDDDFPMISDPSTLDDDFPSICEYVLEPNADRNTGKFSCYLKIKTSVDLSVFKRDSNFSVWLRKERIQLDSTVMEGARTKIIGFLTETMVREDLLSMYEGRIRREVPFALYRRFDIHPGWIRCSRTSSAKVLMVKTTDNYETVINEAFEKMFNSESNIKYFPWQDFSILDVEQ
jgi:hypothetical protein